MAVKDHFQGFKSSRTRFTPVPDTFFHELLPVIDHLGELKITLYAFWALTRKEEPEKYLRKSTLLQDKYLLAALEMPGVTTEESLQEALERAVARGTLLHAEVQFASGNEDFYFMHSEKGLRAIQKLQRGEWQPGQDDEIIALSQDRPTVYTLYEQNIGPLTPMLAEKLRDAEKTFPATWIEEAIGIAVENNVRRWRYIEVILDEWKVRGKDERKDRQDTEKSRQKYLKGWFDE